MDKHFTAEEAPAFPSLVGSPTLVSQVLEQRGAAGHRGPLAEPPAGQAPTGFSRLRAGQLPGPQHREAGAASVLLPCPGLRTASWLRRGPAPSVLPPTHLTSPATHVSQRKSISEPPSGMRPPPPCLSPPPPSVGTQSLSHPSQQNQNTASHPVYKRWRAPNQTERKKSSRHGHRLLRPKTTDHDLHFNRETLLFQWGWPFRLLDSPPRIPT